jgi:tetratricopeptide (TPR) repeat protein
MTDPETREKEFSFKNLFVSLTTLKAIHWIIFIGIIVYANMLFNGFVWDDINYIINNPQIHTLSISTLFNSFRESLFNTGGQYRPFTAIYFLISHAIFGNVSFFYHILQLFLHIINTILLFILFIKFFSKKISLFSSIIFLIHPVQTEAVSYIAASGSPLFFLFGITALLIGINNKTSIQKFIIILSLLLFSMLARETGILFILLLIFYKMLFNKKQLVKYFILSLLTLLIYILIRTIIGGIYLEKLDLALIANLSLVERLINIPEIFYYYIKTFFIPIILSVDQQWTVQKITISNFYFPLLIDLLFLIGICILGFYTRLKRNTLFLTFLFFLVWFVIGIALHLQIFPLDFTVSDRWFYFPIIGLLGIIASAFQILEAHFKKLYIPVIAIALIVICLFSTRTIIRNTNWQNQLTLFTHDIKLQDNFDSQNNLGSAYTLSGNPRQALIHYQKSVNLLPNDTNLFNLGYTYQQLGDLQNAKKNYLKVLDNKKSRSIPKSYAFQSLGFMFLESNPKIAKEYATQGLQEFPNDGSLYSILAISNYKLNDRADALSAAEKAKTFLPNEATNSIYFLILNNQHIDLSGQKFVY